MFKKYRLYIFAVLVFAAIIIFGITCAAKQHYANEERIEIPLPLKDTSEQILYRKGYTVSYNKDYKISNWVAWHLYCKFSRTLRLLVTFPSVSFLK